MKPVVIGFSGGIASGKSTLSKEVAHGLGWQRVSFGDYIRKVATQRGLDTNRDTLQTIGEELINSNVEAFCLAVLAQANWHKPQPLIIDGIRHVEILESLKSIISPMDLVLIYIEVDAQLRLERNHARGMTGSQKDFTLHSTETQVHTWLPSIADRIVDGALPVKDLARDIMTWLSTRSSS